MTALYTPENHEPLTDAPWDEARARQAIEAIVADAEAARGADGFWPEHPDDRDKDGTSLRTGVYMGAAGILWGLHRFGRDHAEAADRLHGSYLRDPDWPGVVPGYWPGEAGILLVAQQLAASVPRADLLLQAIDANAENESNELMWGSPGTMLVARSLYESTGDVRWAAAWSRSADVLWSRWLPSDEPAATSGHSCCTARCASTWARDTASRATFWRSRWTAGCCRRSGGRSWNGGPSRRRRRSPFATATWRTGWR